MRTFVKPNRPTLADRRREEAGAVRPLARKTIHLVVAIVLAGAALTACGSSKNSTSAPASSSGGSSTPVKAITVTIQGYAFHPKDFTVAPGAMITVINKDGVTHTLSTSSGSSASFDTGDLAHNQSKVITAPTTAGKYQYYCMIHSFMTGTMTVS